MTQTIVQCPQCGQSVVWQQDQVWKPFCSERCKLIDLGDWASENHRIPDTSSKIDHVNIDEYNPSDYH
jgi:endogenous inhibitor of DNA gyrase (YacG/DUF329 family)